MPYVIAATYTAKDGEEEGVRSALQAMTPPTREEPGCISYQAHRSVEDPAVFFIYEQYVDEDGFKAHAATAHFEQHIKGEAWPRLADRVVVRAEPLPES